MFKKILLCVLFSLSFVVKADVLQDIQTKGVILIGTTGDYKPFTYHEDGHYSGYDIDVANYFAQQLNVKVKFVPTTWKSMLADLNQHKFDIAMGGITRKMSRQLQAEQSHPYMTFGKVFLVRKGQRAKFDSLTAANKPSVRVGVNIGGTNEKFADQKLSKATIVRFENNLDVPKAVRSGKVDLMVTETPEALFYQAQGIGLSAVRTENPFTKNQFGYLIPKGEQRLLNTVNFMMSQMKMKGIDIQLMKKASLLK